MSLNVCSEGAALTVISSSEWEADPAAGVTVRSRSSSHVQALTALLIGAPVSDLVSSFWGLTVKAFHLQFWPSARATKHQSAADKRVNNAAHQIFILNSRYRAESSKYLISDYDIKLIRKNIKNETYKKSRGRITYDLNSALLENAQYNIFIDIYLIPKTEFYLVICSVMHCIVICP